jgi:coenzyme F420-reducing hydrogenase alpha subunit
MDMANIKTSPSTIEVKHLTRVEGHSNIIVDVWNGVIQHCALEIVEAPRYFEAMLPGTPYDQAPRLAARICGICSVTHTIAAIKALEKALGVTPTQQTIYLRNLMLCAEMLDSHLLHVHMLVAPDLFGAGSIFAVAKDHPDIISRALRMKQVAGQICAVIGGRHTHPAAAAVGGFTHLPTVEELQDLLRQLEKINEDIAVTVDLFSDLNLPDFKRETEYIALQEKDAYSYSSGHIASSDGGSWQVERYREVVNEFQIGHSTAKHARHNRQSYMVGALSRFNLNFDQLHPRAKSASNHLNLIPNCHNPFMITMAQVVEIVHFYEEAIRIINDLLRFGVQWEEFARPIHLSGEGVGACEAPRGTLYHHYVVRNSEIVKANCVIPTGQNLANIEEDMRVLTPQIWSCSRDEIVLILEMLARAYDPCISCATHLIKVNFG